MKTDLLLQQAIALHQAGQLAEAEALYRQILLAAPEQADALHLLGVIAHQVGRNDVALELIDRSGAVNDANAEVWNNRGTVLHALHRYGEAVDSYDRAVALKPEYADAWSSRANSLLSTGALADAAASYERALQLQPGNAQLYAALGTVLHRLGRYRDAMASYERALAIKPDFAEAWNNRGSALIESMQYAEAVESFDRALALKPDYAEAWCNRGNALHPLKRYGDALASYDKALTLGPDFEYLRGKRLHMRRFLCDWVGIEEETRQLEAAVLRGEKVALPFTTLAVSDSPEVQRKAAEVYVWDKLPRCEEAQSPQPRKSGKIRIGYFSADFYNHATSYLIAEVLERHDRSRFEIIGFSFGPENGDAMARRVAAAMDRWIDGRAMTDEQIAQASRELGIDIAVDLKGFTREGRPGIFATGAAPLQVNYLGYPGTMGAEFIDYLIADPMLIPPEAQQHYSEKIVYLPDSYQPNDSQRPCPEAGPSRAEEGLPEAAFVFCCFNNAYKISPGVFDVWMNILRQVEGSVLWLLEECAEASENLRRETAKRGVAPERLVFAKPVDSAHHLARHRLADLLLDTWPYNAHTTASDALWAGLPVLTRSGDTFASRVAASLLKAVGMPELVTRSAQDYEALAIALAQDPERLRSLRERLRQNRPRAALFDSKRYTRNLEAAFAAMHQRRLAGLAPDHLIIS